MRNLVLTILSLFVFLSPALAQTDRATLTGTVTDRGVQLCGESMAQASRIFCTGKWNVGVNSAFSTVPIGSVTPRQSSERSSRSLNEKEGASYRSLARRFPNSGYFLGV
jgi:hypothetical protein